MVNPYDRCSWLCCASFMDFNWLSYLRRARSVPFVECVPDSSMGILYDMHVCYLCQYCDICAMTGHNWPDSGRTESVLDSSMVIPYMICSWLCVFHVIFAASQNWPDSGRTDSPLLWQTCSCASSKVVLFLVVSILLESDQSRRVYSSCVTNCSFGM